MGTSIIQTFAEEKTEELVRTVSKGEKQREERKTKRAKVCFVCISTQINKNTINPSKM